MANESLFYIGAGEFIPQEAMRPIPPSVGPASDLLPPDYPSPISGPRMPHAIRRSLYFVRPVPYEMTISTGITFALVYTMASTNNADLRGGTRVLMEVAAGALVSGSSHPDDAALEGAVAAQSQDLPTVPGTIVVQEIAVPRPVGGAPLGPGALALIRVRRLGDDPADTNFGDILFIGLTVRNT
jgi:hypothetical protein